MTIGDPTGRRAAPPICCDRRHACERCSVASRTRPPRPPAGAFLCPPIWRRPLRGGRPSRPVVLCRRGAARIVPCRRLFYAASSSSGRQCARHCDPGRHPCPAGSPLCGCLSRVLHALRRLGPVSRGHSGCPRQSGRLLLGFFNGWWSTCSWSAGAMPSSASSSSWRPPMPASPYDDAGQGYRSLGPDAKRRRPAAMRSGPSPLH